MYRNYREKHHQQNTGRNRREILGIEDRIEKVDSSVKENVKSNKFLTQNIQELWDTMKRQNLRIIGIEGEESQFKGTKPYSTKKFNIFNKQSRRKLFQPKEGHAYKGTRSLQDTK